MPVEETSPLRNKRSIDRSIRTVGGAELLKGDMLIVGVRVEKRARSEHEDTSATVDVVRNIGTSAKNGCLQTRQGQQLDRITHYLGLNIEVDTGESERGLTRRSLDRFTTRFSDMNRSHPKAELREWRDDIPRAAPPHYSQIESRSTEYGMRPEIKRSKSIPQLYQKSVRPANTPF